MIATPSPASIPLSANAFARRFERSWTSEKVSSPGSSTSATSSPWLIAAAEIPAAGEAP